MGRRLRRATMFVLPALVLLEVALHEKGLGLVQSLSCQWWPSLLLQLLLQLPEKARCLH
jgi:hypothetical protein